MFYIKPSFQRCPGRSLLLLVRLLSFYLGLFLNWIYYKIPLVADTEGGDGTGNKSNNGIEVVEADSLLISPVNAEPNLEPSTQVKYLEKYFHYLL